MMPGGCVVIWPGFLFCAYAQEYTTLKVCCQAPKMIKKHTESILSALLTR